MDQAPRTGTGKFKTGVSGNPSGRPRKDAAPVPQAPTVTTSRFDSWASLISGIGTMRDKRQASQFFADTVTLTEAATIWRGDDIGGRIIETWPNEMLREGFDLEIKAKRDKLTASQATDLKEQVETIWESLDVVGELWQAYCYRRAYGGGAIFLGVDDGLPLSEPLDLKRVRALNYLTTYEPSELTPYKFYSNPTRPKYSKPATYMLSTFAHGQPADPTQPNSVFNVEIHESRLVVFNGTQVTRNHVSTTNGWGDSVFVRVLRVLRDFQASWDAAGILMVDFAAPTYKMKGLNELLVEDTADLFKNRMAGMELARSVARVTMVDAEDEFKREPTPVTGLPDLLDRFQARLAAAADMPVTLLMGVSPGGLNATGESDIKFFYDRVKTKQTRELKPAIRRITEIIFAVLKHKPDAWSIKFRPLWQPTEMEQAQTRLIQMQVDIGYAGAGMLANTEVRNSRFGGDGYSYQTQIEDDSEDPTLDPGDVAAFQQEMKAPNAPAGGAPAGADIQKTALNGAQVSSMLEVITAFASGAISRESAKAVLMVGFQLDDSAAEAALGPATFEPKKPEPALMTATPGAKPVPDPVAEPAPPIKQDTRDPLTGAQIESVANILAAVQHKDINNTRARSMLRATLRLDDAGIAQIFDGEITRQCSRQDIATSDQLDAVANVLAALDRGDLLRAQVRGLLSYALHLNSADVDTMIGGVDGSV